MNRLRGTHAHAHLHAYVFAGHIEAGEMGCACIPGKESVFKDSLDKTLTYAKALNCGM